MKGGKFVVPLEIQLETNLNRGLENRVDEIIAVFQKSGYDRTLVQKSLNKGQWERFERRTEKEKVKSK